MNAIKGKTNHAVKQVVSPEHPFWDAFMAGLQKAVEAEGCDSQSLRLSQRLLRKMPGIDVAGSLDLFRQRGGYCDCEVLLNVA